MILDVLSLVSTAWADTVAGAGDTLAGTVANAAADSASDAVNSAAPAVHTSGLMRLGAIGFGAVIGWNVYYINRYRKGDVQLSDLVTLVSVLGGAAILRLFPAGSELVQRFAAGEDQGNQDGVSPSFRTPCGFGAVQVFSG